MKNPTISLWQPWAMLWALGEKRFETRHWQFPRALEGRTIYIHAAQKWNKDLAHLCCTQPFVDAFRKYPEIVGPFAHEVPGVQYRKIIVGKFESLKLPFGCILGTVQLAYDLDVYTALDLLPTERRQQEEAFGDYSPGRRAWIGQKHTVLPQFIPYVGKQSFFDYREGQ